MIRMDTLAGHLVAETGLNPSLFSCVSSEYEILSFSNFEGVIQLTRRYKGSIQIMEMHKFRDVIPVEIHLKEWFNEGNADESYSIDTWENLTDKACLMVVDCRFRESIKLVELATDEDYDFERTIKYKGKKYKEVEIVEPKGI